MPEHGCTAQKGAHDRGAGLVELRARRQREPGHWTQGTGAQGKCIWCGMKMSRGPPFYKAVGQLEGPGVA